MSEYTDALDDINQLDNGPSLVSAIKRKVSEILNEKKQLGRRMEAAQDIIRELNIEEEGIEEGLKQGKKMIATLKTDLKKLAEEKESLTGKVTTLETEKTDLENKSKARERLDRGLEIAKGVGADEAVFKTALKLLPGDLDFKAEDEKFYVLADGKSIEAKEYFQGQEVIKPILGSLFTGSDDSSGGDDDRGGGRAKGKLTAPDSGNPPGDGKGEKKTVTGRKFRRGSIAS